MADFARRRTIETRTPVLTVERLSVGRHELELVVTDQAGHRSRPARVRVTVVPTGRRRPPGRVRSPSGDPRPGRDRSSDS